MPSARSAAARPGPAWITWTRQSHALEHATIHVLSQRVAGLHLMGRSAPHGFYLYGDVPTAVVASAAAEALARLKAGELELAVHPRCGTNLVVSALLAGVASTVIFSRQRKFRWEALPELFIAIMLALFLGQPAGYAVQQRFTTLADLDDVSLGAITRQAAGRTTVHRVELTRD
jgi:Domain of unknown function (DUF6391)